MGKCQRKLSRHIAPNIAPNRYRINLKNMGKEPFINICQLVLLILSLGTSDCSKKKKDCDCTYH